MKGAIDLRKDLKHPWWYIVWYNHRTGKNERISRYTDGSRMYQTHPDKKRDFGYRQAEKLLAQMQSDVERGVFRIEKYTGIQRTDVDQFYREWMDEVIKRTLKPGTIHVYEVYLRKWIGPWFQEKSIQLHEIDYHVLIKLKNYISDAGCSPKYTWNVLNALHSMLRYAARVKGLPMPEFPAKKSYGLIKKKPQWLPKDEFWRVIDAIPDQHQPIFLWLYYHYRRPGEACVLRKADFDQINRAFYIRRTLSNRQEVKTTKTSAEHYIPCKAAFLGTATRLLDENPESPYLFVNGRGRKWNGRYTLEALRRIWYKASDAAGVARKWVYQSTKHTGCTHFIEDGGTVDELQMLTDHRRRDSVEAYADVTLNRKRELMEKHDNVVGLDKIKKA